MLNGQEQPVWDDVQRFWALEAEEPPLLAPSELSSRWVWHDQDDLPVALAAGVWIAIALVLFGAVVAGLAVAAVTAVAWALWRRLPWVARVVAPRVATRGPIPPRAPHPEALGASTPSRDRHLTEGWEALTWRRWEETDVDGTRRRLVASRSTVAGVASALLSTR